MNYKCKTFIKFTLEQSPIMGRATGPSPQSWGCGGVVLLDGHMTQHVINWKNLAPSSKVRSLQLCDF